MVGQYLPQTNETCYSVLQCVMCLFAYLFTPSKHSLSEFSWTEQRDFSLLVTQQMVLQMASCLLHDWGTACWLVTWLSEFQQGPPPSSSKKKGQHPKFLFNAGIYISARSFSFHDISESDRNEWMICIWKPHYRSKTRITANSRCNKFICYMDNSKTIFIQQKKKRRWYNRQQI